MNEIHKILYGLSFFKKSFQGWWVIASYHHPDSITWRWSIAFDGRNPPKRFFPRFGPSYSMGTKFLSPSGQLGMWLSIPMVGVFSFNSQGHMWRKEQH